MTALTNFTATQIDGTPVSFADLQGSTTDELSTQKQPAFFKLRVILKPADQRLPAVAEVKQP